MATTIASSDLTTRVTETITLNGTTFDTTSTYTVTGVTQFVNNVFNVDTGSQNIILFARTGVAPRNTEYDIDEVKYLRLTNADDTNTIEVQVTYLTGGVLLKQTIEPLGSFIMTNFFISTDFVSTITIVTSANVDVPYSIGLSK